MKPKASSTDRAKPKDGAEIVWRYKDNKGWHCGVIRAVLGGGRIVEIGETAYSTFGVDRVALNDIDWYPK